MCGQDSLALRNVARIDGRSNSHNDVRGLGVCGSGREVCHKDKSDEEGNQSHGFVVS